jgi:hypothetical protein
MTTYLCWHLPDGSPERGEEIGADSAEAAALSFADMFFHDSEGEWMGGSVMVQRLDAALDGIGEPTRFEADVALVDLAVTVKPAD